MRNAFYLESPSLLNTLIKLVFWNSADTKSSISAVSKSAYSRVNQYGIEDILPLVSLFEL